MAEFTENERVAAIRAATQAARELEAAALLLASKSSLTLVAGHLTEAAKQTQDLIQKFFKDATD